MAKIKLKKSNNQTADYLTPDELNRLLKYLANNEKWFYYLIVRIGVSTALRFSDLIQLTWVDLLGKSDLEIKEQKTGKIRSIPLSKELSALISGIYDKMGKPNKDEKLFAISNTGINKQLKLYAAKAGIRGKQITTHTFRKTMAREVWERNDCSDAVLTKLSVLLRHSSTQITRLYLGITQAEVKDLYSFDDLFIY